MSTVHLYGWGHETDPNSPWFPVGDDATSIGAATYGARWDDLIIHATARDKITEARRILDWCRQFTCRFENPPADLISLIGEE